MMKNEIIGWESKYSSITFCMSSQLWYVFNIDDIKKYKLFTTVVENGNRKMKYAEIYESNSRF